MAVNNAALYLRINIAISALATLAVALRYIARVFVKGGYGLDDVLILLAWFVLLGLNINGGFLYMNGGADGTPFSELSFTQLETFFKCFYISQILYYFCMLPTKLSILALYGRIFTFRSFQIAIWVVVAICCAWFTGSIIPTIVQCRPIEHVWNQSVSATCINISMLFSAITIANLLTDVIILCMPMFAVSKLNISPQRRLGVMGIFLLGSTACICALVRVISQTRFNNDVGALIVDCALWTVIEPALAVLAACLPTLRPLVPTGKIAAFYSSFTGSGVTSSSNAGSKKQRASWLWVSDRSKSSSAARSTGTGKSQDHGMDDGYPLKGFDKYGQVHSYSVAVPGRTMRGMSGHIKDTDEIESYGDGQFGMNGIYVTKSVTVREASILDH